MLNRLDGMPIRVGEDLRLRFLIKSKEAAMERRTGAVSQAILVSATNCGAPISRRSTAEARRIEAVFREGRLLASSKHGAAGKTSTI